MQIGKIIKEFVESEVPDKKDYKVKLGMGYEGMYKYFVGDREPGYKVLKRLVELGFDITSIFPPMKKNTIKKSS